MAPIFRCTSISVNSRNDSSEEPHSHHAYFVAMPTVVGAPCTTPHLIYWAKYRERWNDIKGVDTSSGLLQASVSRLFKWKLKSIMGQSEWILDISMIEVTRQAFERRLTMTGHSLILFEVMTQLNANACIIYHRRYILRPNMISY